MKNDDSLPVASIPAQKSDSRRQFLQGAGVAAGALILTRTLPADAQEGAAPAPVADTSGVLNLADHKELQAVGGSEVVLVGGEKVIIAHTETGFVACSAVCTHRGCIVDYKAADKAFVCPCHGARFDETGKVAKGPARTNLKPFDIGNALIVKPK